MVWTSEPQNLSAILETLQLMSPLRSFPSSDVQARVRASLLRLTWLASQFPLDDRLRSELHAFNRELRPGPASDPHPSLIL